MYFFSIARWCKKHVPASPMYARPFVRSWMKLIKLRRRQGRGLSFWGNGSYFEWLLFRLSIVIVVLGLCANYSNDELEALTIFTHFLKSFSRIKEHYCFTNPDTKINWFNLHYKKCIAKLCWWTNCLNCSNVANPNKNHCPDKRSSEILPPIRFRKRTPFATE